MLLHIPISENINTIIDKEQFDIIIDNTVHSFVDQLHLTQDEEDLPLKVIESNHRLACEIWLTKDQLYMKVRNNPLYGAYTEWAYLSYNFETNTFFSYLNADLIEEKFKKILLAYKLAS